MSVAVLVVGGACAAFALLPAAVPAAAAPSDDFVTVWSVTWDDRTIKIPVGGATGTYAIDWGDGNTAPNASGDQEHTYAQAGTYTVRISGDFTRILLGGDPANSQKLDSIEQWGSIQWSSMESAFAGASNMRYNADDYPDLSGVSSMSKMFSSTYFDADISGWDTSSVTDMSYMFSDTDFNGNISGWDTSSVTNMSGMFSGTDTFDADISGWDTSSVTDMSHMFSYTDTFDADISGWDTSSVTNMSNMLNGAFLFYVDLSGWNTSSVTDMSNMLNGAYYFTSDISDWDTSSVTDMSNMFYDGAYFYSVGLSNWDTSSVTNMSGMFSRADTLNIDISNWNTSSVTDMSNMFYDARFFDVDLSGWDTSSVTNMSGMFYATYYFTPDISGWNTSSVTDMSNMFYFTSYYYIDISDWDTSSVTNMSGMFSHAYFTSDISGWDTSSVTDMSHMFSGASSYGDEADISDWNTSSVTNMSGMFSRVYFTSDISGWDTSSVTDMSHMFSGPASHYGNISNWDTSSVTDMSYMFSDTDTFDADISNWNTSSVTDMSGMFSGTDTFGADISGLDTSSVTDMSYMFSYITVNTIDFDISDWDTSSVTDMSYMFYGASIYNADISGLDTSSVTDMSYMFSYIYFNADISGLDTSSVTNMSHMFSGASTFNADISGWDVSNVVGMDYMFFYADDFDQNLGPWYITLNSTRIGGDDTYAAEIAAQNNVLRGHNPSYSLVDTGAYPDNANFTISSDNVLMFKPNVPSKDSYLINIGAESPSLFGTGNMRELEIFASSHQNRPPVADAGSDQTVPEGATVTLDGSSSSDPDGNTISYIWIAPQGITLQNDNTAAPSFTAPSVTSDTTYTLTLAVSDGAATDTDTMTVTVRNVNQPPTADAGADQTVPEGATVTLDGSSSSDPDGNTISYSWTAPQGITLQNDNTAAPSFTAPSVTSDTTYTLTLAVSDGAATDTDTMTVTVRNVNQPPTADAGADQTVPEGATVTLDGSSSSDPDGNTISYSWTAPQGITLQNDNTAAPSFTAPSVTSDTTYTLTLAVSDGAATDTDTMTVTVRNVNQPPTADAGADQTVPEGATVTLDGSSSSDPDGNTISYSWTAPQGITLQNDNTAAPSFTAPSVTSDTTYTLTLAVSDGAATDTDTMTVTVRNVNQPPTADAGADQTVPEGATVTLDGSSSSDPDGNTISYSWTAPQGITLQNDNTAAPSFTAPSVTSDTTYTLTLAVSDGAATDTDTVVVTVRNASAPPLPNRAPVADAGNSLAVPEGATVHLNGFASSDPDGDAITYVWIISPSVTLKNADTPAPSFTAPGVASDTDYTLTLTISDGTDTATDTVVVTVKNNLRPVADAGSALTAREGATVHLNGFASSDPDGDSITYDWTISPSVTLKNANTAAPSFTAPSVSSDTTYTLTLTVSDGTDTATDTVVVTVKNNLRPIADAGRNLTVQEGATVHLNGFASSDPDGDSITYDWTISPSVTLKNADTPAPSFTAPSVESDTTYTLTLTVSDGTDTTTDTVVVTVRNAPAQ